MKSWWKSPRIIGNSAYVVMLMLARSLRIKVHTSDLVDPNKAYIFAFWHGKQLIPSYMMSKVHNTRKCILVSPSRDGAMLAIYLKKFKYEVIRGSSRDANVEALRSLKSMIDNDVSVGTAIDGPIGPIYVVKPGIPYLAQKSGIPIIPIGTALGKSWIFNKAWDKFEIPKPFAKVGFVIGDPIYIDKDQDIKDACVKVATLLNKTDDEARKLISG